MPCGERATGEHVRLLHAPARHSLPVSMYVCTYPRYRSCKYTSLLEYCTYIQRTMYNGSRFVAARKLLVHASRTCTRVSALALAAIASSHSSHTHSRVEQPSRLSLPAPRIVSIHLVRVSTSSSASSAPSPCRSIESPDPLRATNTGARCDALAEHPSRSPSDQPASIYMYALHNRLSPGQRCTSESECAPNANALLAITTEPPAICASRRSKRPVTWPHLRPRWGPWNR
jgi:hypothetical protein